MLMLMKKKLTLFVVALMGVLSMTAQNGWLPAEVSNPGYKGALPEVAPLAPARQGELPILTLYHVGFDPYIINGRVRMQAEMSFPFVSEAGCEYYTMRYRAHGSSTWNYIMDGDTPQHYGSSYVGVSPSISYVTDYQLELHGGEMDGYVSNIVTATPPTMYSRYRGWSEDPTIERALVGIPVGQQFSVSAETYQDGNITGYSTEENPDYFTFQWYRRNPNNWDMEKIEDATTAVYTPTIEDLGYQLVIQVGGDKVHCDFTLNHPLNGVVCVPVLASVSYIGADGFVLNTDYVIPEPQQMFKRMEYDWMENAPQFDPSCISERTPGQYVFRTPMEDYNYRIFELVNPAYFLTFYYEMMGWYREVQIMSDVYTAGLGVKAEIAGQSVHTTIDVIGQNIDGEWVTVTSGELTEAGNDILYFGNDIYRRPYYLRANATDGTQTTYYPSALSMSEAETVMPGEVWAAPEFTIQVLGSNIPDEGEDAWLLLWQTDGWIAAYHVNTHPRIKHQDGNFLIISDEVDIAYPVADVRKFTMVKDLTDYADAINRIPQDEEQTPGFSLNKARPGSVVSIYDMSGRKVDAFTVGADGSLQYSLDSHPAGVYIIKTETTTIKIIKK